MSKLDIGVGDEFPLNESADHGHERGHRGRHGHHHHRHHMHRGGHHHHHRPHVFGRVATLLLIAGLAALIVEHKLPAAAFGMIGLGIAGVVTMAALHWRHRRRQPRQVS
jgi:hypothetical protein